MGIVLATIVNPEINESQPTYIYSTAHSHQKTQRRGDGSITQKNLSPRLPRALRSRFTSYSLSLNSALLSLLVRRTRVFDSIQYNSTAQRTWRLTRRRGYLFSGIAKCEPSPQEW